jgi:ABC-type transport system involved in cytochrome c biogenesis ATPase subunit
MPRKINKIAMAGFRGAVLPKEISFDASKSVTLIFGENGTGKSTIADAFAFICNRSYGSIENYSLGDSPRKHMASLGHNPSDLKVSLSCGSSTWFATLTKEGPVVSPATGCPDARILHRKSILKLVEAQPKQRYETLKTFIAVPGIEKSEAALRDAVKTIDTDYNEAVRAFDQANNGLETLWKAEGEPGKAAIEWGKKEAERNVDQIQANVTELSRIEDAFQGAETALTRLTTAMSESKSAREALVAEEGQQKNAEKAQTLGSGQLVQLLHEAKQYVAEKSGLTQCPVCEKGIIRQDLLRRLDQRIKEMKQIASLASATAVARKTLENKTILLKEAQKVFCQRTKVLASFLKLSSLMEIKRLEINWTHFVTMLKHQDPSDGVEQEGRRLLLLTSPYRKSLLTKKESDQKSINQHNAIKGHVDTLKEKLVTAKASEALFTKLKEALDVLSQQRKSYVETILESISDDVETLYTTLHPGEGIGEIRFIIRPNMIGSLELEAKFQNISDLPPQAYYSESHLDTLGICVFLALAKRFKSDDTIVILDDVLTSADGPHLDRFMALLHEQTASFNQVIITTHYRPWRDRYRWAKGPTASTQIIELGPWTLQNGIRTSEFLTAVEELKHNFTETKFDRQAVASKAGIVLESLLDFLTLKYQCKVPRNARSEYTLGDLATGVDTKLSKELRILKATTSGGSKKETTLKPLIDACISEQWIRNSVGCHFSALGSEVTDDDVRRFSNAVIVLADEMICGSCGMLSTRRPSGSNWQCKCGELELYPLVYPGADLGTINDEG